MQELTPFQKRSDRFRNSLRSSVEHFRKGDDHLGLDHFLNSMDDLENLLEFQQYAGDPGRKIDKIVSVLQNLYEHVKNQDVIGITDVLEFILYPLTEEWTEEVIDQ